MFLVQIGFSLVVFYRGVFQRYLDQEEILLTLSILIFVALTHLHHLFPVTAGVSITTIIDDTIVIGKVRIAYQMVLAALAGILVTASMSSGSSRPAPV